MQGARRVQTVAGSDLPPGVQMVNGVESVDGLFDILPRWALLLLALVGAGVLASTALTVVVFLFKALLVFLVKLGVRVTYSGTPPHIDAGDYRLDQGHEVRPELRDRRD